MNDDTAGASTAPAPTPTPNPVESQIEKDRAAWNKASGDAQQILVEKEKRELSLKEELEKIYKGFDVMVMGNQISITAPYNYMFTARDLKAEAQYAAAWALLMDTDPDHEADGFNKYFHVTLREYSGKHRTVEVIVERKDFPTLESVSAELDRSNKAAKRK